MKGERKILRPIITEKGMRLTNVGQYVFKVASRANKTEIKKAVEKAFDVKVVGVRIANMPAKETRRGRVSGKISAWKKAIIKLESGNKIEIFGKA